MKDLIFYDNIYSDSEISGYLDICNSDNNWIKEEYKVDCDAKRKVIYLNENYDNVSPHNLIESYSSILPEVTKLSFMQKFMDGFSVDYKISKYEPGDNFDWHCDEFRKHHKNHAWARVISSITYLNANYEGGETEFVDLIIKPEIGKTLIFPSNWCFPHRGNVVQSGVKYILVIHIWA
jgi:hypothetical protein